ncbi:MAG: hypothetical protein AAF806_20485 [Bacteroidota bacterium]
MNLDKASILLEKINALHKGMQADGKISEIEKDLMMSYVRQLYEEYMSIPKNAKVPIPRPEPTVVKEKPLAFETEIIRKRAEPRVVEKPKETYKPPRIIEIPKEVKEEIQTPPPAYEASPRPAYQEPKPEPKPSYQAPKARPVPATSTAAVSKEIKALFKEKKAKELSEKLSASPIRDLTKAISLNDKLLFSNELFSGALVTFNEVTRTLNDMPSKADAENYLMELAKQHNWTEDEKQDSAKAFIKLVRRRFV